MTHLRLHDSGCSACLFNKPVNGWGCPGINGKTHDYLRTLKAAFDLTCRMYKYLCLDFLPDQVTCTFLDNL